MQKSAHKMLVQLILVFYVLKKNITATFQARFVSALNRAFKM